MMMDQQINVSIDIDSKAKFKKLAKDTGLKQAHIFRKMIAMTVERYEREKSGAFLLHSE